MKRGTTIALTLGGVTVLAVGAMLMNTVDKLKNLSYKIVNIKSSKKLKGLKQLKTILLSIEVHNPNKNEVRFKSFVADVTYDNTIISNINLTRNIDLAANGKTIIADIPFNISWVDLAVIFINKIGTGIPKSFVININGTLKADGFALPVNEKFNVAK